MVANIIHNEDNLATMGRFNDGTIQTIVTSPPYNIGKEYEAKLGFDRYVNETALRFAEYYRVLNETGSLFFQVGIYAHAGVVYPLDCVFFPELLKLGFIPRGRIVWTFGHGLHCKRRFSGRHETILWFTKTDNYAFNLDPVRIPSKYPNKKHYKGSKKGELSGNPLGKNPSDVWEITNVKNNHPEKTEHPCQFPIELVTRCILATSNQGDVIYDPYMGSGTTAVAAIQQGREFIGSETNLSYIAIAEQRISNERMQMELFKAS